jgi:predicted MFS family arabinose efflux permease
VLVIVGLLNYLDRALPAVLAEPIKSDLTLSDTGLGLINGAGFLLVYAFAAVPIARMADRGRQAAVIAASLGVWSLMTLAGGAVASGWQLALTRMGVALGEAGSLPASHAYLTRRYPPERRALALSMLSLAVPLGNSIGLMAGGMLGRVLGWRGAFMTMGMVGLALAPLIYFILSKANGSEPAHAPTSSSSGSLLDPVLTVDRGAGIGLILAASSLVAIGGYAAIAFVPAFLMRVHGLALQVVGIRFGLAAGAAGVTALLLTGWWSDRLVARGKQSPLMAVVVMILAAVPFSSAAFLVGDSDLALALATVGSVVPVAYLAPVVASLHRLVTPNHRAQVSALLLLCTALLGSLGPLAVGIVSDSLRGIYGNASLRLAMLIIPSAYSAAAAVFWLAARRHPLKATYVSRLV